MWAERKNFQAGVHHKKISLLFPNGHSKLPWPIMPLVKSSIVLRKRLLKHISRASGWLPCHHFEGTIWNPVCLPKLFLLSFMHAMRSSEFLLDISNSKGFYLKIKVGSVLDGIKCLSASSGSGHPVRVILFYVVTVFIRLGCFPWEGHPSQSFYPYHRELEQGHNQTEVRKRSQLILEWLKGIGPAEAPHS